MSTHNGPFREVSKSSGRRRAVLLGLALAIPGMLVGMIVGADIGGNWFTSFSLGTAHGYEATANIGTVVGGVAFGALGVWLGLRRTHRKS
jgi:hypothetical protein